MTSQPHDEPEIDYDRLREKYAEERAKRLRSDALGQYQEPTGAFADFGRDPNADPDFTRDPVVRDADVLVIGRPITRAAVPADGAVALASELARAS